MIITIGKYKGKSVSEVVLKHPQYVQWVLEQTDATGQLKTIRNEMIRLISIFDSKTFTKKCRTENCDQPATRCSVYGEDYIGLYWWCDKCDPYQLLYQPSKIHIISKYQDVIGYTHTVFPALIKRLAQEKRLPTRVKKGDIEKFFLEPGILTF